MEPTDDLHQYWNHIMPRLQQMISEALCDRSNLHKKLNDLDHYIHYNAYPKKEKVMYHIETLISDIINENN